VVLFNLVVEDSSVIFFLAWAASSDFELAKLNDDLQFTSDLWHIAKTSGSIFSFRRAEPEIRTGYIIMLSNSNGVLSHPSLILDCLCFFFLRGLLKSETHGTGSACYRSSPRCCYCYGGRSLSFGASPIGI
jgi:hypothetical protein